MTPEQRAKELLAKEYERGGKEGPYPTYAALARAGKGDFTLCSIRAIEAAYIAGFYQCRDAAAKIAETSKGHSTSISQAIRALEPSDTGEPTEEKGER